MMPHKLTVPRDRKSCAVTLGTFHETCLSHRVRKEKHALMLCQHIRKPVKTRRGCSCQMIEVLGSPILGLHSFLVFCDWQIDSFCSAGVYKPTQDPEGLQLKTLEALGSSIFGWCSGTLDHPAASLSADSAACRQALSAARVLGVLMDVEHRAVHPALDQLWGVVWRCAVLEEGDRITPRSFLYAMHVLF